MSITVFSDLSQLPQGCCLAPCAVSGGTLQAYLAQLAALEGPVCIHLRPIFLDLMLPCLTGQGEELSPSQLKALHQEEPCYFSSALCTEYFTYVREDTLHVVLFDTPESLRQKARAIREAGIRMVLAEDGQLRGLL